jgi:hypothetical protein
MEMLRNVMKISRLSVFGPRIVPKREILCKNYSSYEKISTFFSSFHSFHHCSVPVFIIMLLLTDGQTSKPGTLQRKRNLSGMLGKICSHFTLTAVVFKTLLSV